MNKICFFLVALLYSAISFSQGTITGAIIDGEEGGPLPGANVLVQGTTNGVAADFDGNFSIDIDQDSGTLVISYLGFVSQKVKFNGPGSIGTIYLAPDAEELEGVVIIGSGIIDLAQDRQTPIAVSTISAKQIEAKVGNSDLPEILKSTPSVQNVQKGGFGDGQMYLRGFDQTNTAFLLNGQPINGMEDGKMYWSNWTGVLDIANAVQVQRGLGSSKLAISSVGGTVNIVTKTVDMKEGGFFKTMVANNNYLKTVGYYSTGLMENGLAVSAMLGHWQGDGYMEGAAGEGQTYFFSVGYKPNEHHIFNFLITGAPQWHGAAGGMKLDDYLQNSRRYSDFWGYYQGKEYAGGRNYYHKPIANLNWDWNINDRATLSTVLYGSMGRGGFAYPEGSSFYGFRTPEGKLDYDAIAANNRANGASNFVKTSVNAHNWYGVVSNFNQKLTDELSFNVGADARFYNGIHYRAAADLLGATVNVNNAFTGSYTITEDTGFSPWKNMFSTVDRDQRYSYDYEENINYLGAFGQLEYAKDAFSAYFQGAFSNQSHAKTDYWNYSTAEETPKINNTGYNLKAGASYSINDNNIVFANGGYYSRQPYHDDLFTNIRASNELNPYGQENQKITGLEFGYKFKSEFVSANFNLYNTIWDNRILSSAKDTDNNGQSDLFTQSSGIKEVHRGAELEIFARPTETIRINGFASLGNWFYKGDVVTRSYDDQNNLIDSGNVAFIDGVKIGNAAQFTAGINGSVEIVENLSVDATLNYYDKLYSEIDLTATEFAAQNNRGALELPSYETVDAGLSYKMPLGEGYKKSLQLRLNVNNIFDKFYIENSTTNIYTESGDDTWNGINTNNKVYIGYGTTWNLSARFNF